MVCIDDLIGRPFVQRNGRPASGADKERVPVKNLPTRRNLKKLSLRAAVALSLRAVQRVTPLLPAISDTAEDALRVSYDRAFNIGLPLAESFCDGTLRGDATRLAKIMEDAKWDPGIENTVEIADPVLKAGDNAFSAAMHAQFGDFCEPRIATFSTANNVIEKARQSLTAALDASVRAGEAYSSLFLKETSRDFELLFARNTALFPEIGPPIDTTATGPLEDLWHGTVPPQASPVDHEKRKPEPLPPEKGEGKEELSPNTTAGGTSSKGLSSAFATETHSPEEGYLYKYLKFADLLKVLKNATLKFSRVSDFNDPFDGQLLPIRNFGSKQFFDALRDETKRLVATQDEPIYLFPGDIPAESALSAIAQQVLELVQSGKSISISHSSHDAPEEIEPLSKLLMPMIYLAQQGVLGSKEEAVACLDGLLDLFKNQRIPLPSVSNPERRQFAYLAEVVQALCLTEVPDSLLMWSHYAKYHTGAVLKFDACPETDDYFATAQPVKYEKKLPSFEQPRDLVRRYLGLPAETGDFMSRQFFTKSEEWEYEKEWRVIATTEMKEHGDCVPFKAGSLAAIYLGCKVTTPQVHQVLDLVTNKRYSTDIYIAVKDDAEFALSFVPVSNGRARTSDIPMMDINERGRLYRWCLDAYFDFWNEPDDDLHGDLRRLRCEGVLADYGPPNSVGFFREMMLKLQDTHTATAKPTISVDKDKEPEEYEKQRSNILQPSAKAYGALDDLLKEDLARRGGTLPERKEAPEL